MLLSRCSVSSSYSEWRYSLTSHEKSSVNQAFMLDFQPLPEAMSAIMFVTAQELM